MTTLTEVVQPSSVTGKFGFSRSAGSGRFAADSQSGNDRRQRLAGCSLLVLPRRLAMLPRRRKHLLCRYADGHQPRARHSGRGPLRGRESIGFGARDGRAGRADGDPQTPKGERVVDAEDYFIGPGSTSPA